MFQEMVGMKLAVRKVLSQKQIGLLLAKDSGIFSSQKRWTNRTERRSNRGKVVIRK